MSGYVYPPIVGLKFPVVRHTLWNTLTDTSYSQRMSTLSLQQYAMYSWELEYELIRNDRVPSDYKALTGLFNAVSGMADSFLFTDPTYNTAVNEPMGVGDGVTTVFQTVVTFKNAGGPGRADIVQNFNGAPVFAVSGGGNPSHTLGPSGVVTFLTPPAIGAIVSWSGSFYFRCRFLQDKLPISEMMQGWWETAGSPILIGSILL
jgi:hypothetical protein